MTTPQYIDRELSWLEFNQRVLDEAKDPTVPLLERLRFLTITSSNLDEFFMVRVGGLQMLEDQQAARRDASAATTAERLEAISDRARAMVADQYATLADIMTQLAQHGVRHLRADQLTQGQATVAQRHFEERVLLVATPMALDEHTQFPLLVGGTLNLLVVLEPAPGATDPRIAVIPLGTAMERVIFLPGEGRSFILLEELASMFIDRFFPGQRIRECLTFRITRNADVGVREDMAADLLAEMEHILDARKESHCVRLEIPDSTSDDARTYLQSRLGVNDADIYACAGPLDLADLAPITSAKGLDELRFEPWPPHPHPDVSSTESMFDLLSRQELVLSHPFDSFEPVLRLINEAADDPDVIAIKQVLYRTSERSPVVAALKRAALKGKYVTAVVELKARFDEARNIEWARDLERAGAQVIYGVKGYKIHAKVCLIVRREAGSIKRYVHYGTGNYNEITARFYTDISYLSCDDDLGADASTFFNAVNGYSQVQHFRRIRMAPIGLRDALLVRIQSEAERTRHGQKGRIVLKMNSLADPAIIDALYEASQAGVKIDLIVRGICRLRPGVPGLSDNITVISIIDRFLEHSRIYYFRRGGDQRVLIASADCMPRNLDRRLELLVPVDDEAGRRRLIDILDTCLRDKRKGRRLLADGGYDKPASADATSSQETLYRAAGRLSTDARPPETLVFEPHRAPSESNPTS